MGSRFEGKKALVTSVDRYTGSPIATALKDEGAEVITDNSLLKNQSEIDALVAKFGDIDILIANFAEDPMPKEVVDILDEELELLYQTN